MNTDQGAESGETIPLILQPLTPDEWERNQALCDELLDYMFEDKSKTN